ncbi:MAG: NAD-dependent epimerase/dehydratase family protein [Patescibacteria group bacterium]|mgnify:CR=1 FL=1
MKNLKNKKILITGAYGFLGSNLVKRLLDIGSEVITCDNLSRRGAELNFEDLKKEYGNLNNIQAEISDIPTYIMKFKPDLIYHFAAQVAVTTSIISPVSDFRVNAEGTFGVARAAKEFNIPVIYSSTNKAYGDNVNQVSILEMKTRYDFKGALRRKGINEEFSIDAAHHTPYGCSKLAGELYVREYGGLVNRFSCMYGEWQHGIVDQGWLSYFIMQKLKNKPVTIFGNGKQVRDMLYVSDVIDLLLLEGSKFISSPVSMRSEVFTVGGGYNNTISLLELCSKLKIKPKFSDWRPADQKVFYCDTTKAKKVLGWAPKVSVDDGLSKLYKWTEKNIQRLG